MREETTSPFSRAPSRTRAASARSASARIVSRDQGEPISSSGLQMYVMLPNPSNPAACSTSTAKKPVSSPPFMSVTPGPNARSPSIRNGRSATVPGSNTVSV